MSGTSHLIPANLAEHRLLKVSRSASKPPWANPKRGTGLGMVAKDLPPIIVGDGVVVGDHPSGLAVLPHIPNIDDGLNSVVVS